MSQTRTVLVAQAGERNGTATNALPILVADIDLDDIGYPSWRASMRLNIRARTYDAFLSQDRDEFWRAFTEIAVDWNFLDEDGSRMPLPREGLGPRDLPIDILNTLVLRYVEAMADSAAVPKARGADSATTFPTNATDPSGGPA